MKTVPPWVLPALGAVLFLTGLLAARARLAEWSPAALPAPGFFLDRYQAIAGRLGVEVGAAPPRFALRLDAAQIDRAYRALAAAGRRPEARATGVRAEVTREVRRPGDRLPFHLTLGFSADGQPRTVETDVPLHALPGPAESPIAARQLELAFAGQLLAPGEVPTARREAGTEVCYSIAGPAAGAAEIVCTGEAGRGFRADRRPGTLAGAAAGRRATVADRVARLARELGLLAVIGLFFVSTVKGRIDLVNGSLVAGLALATLMPAAVAGATDLATATQSLLGAALGTGLTLGLAWSAGESWLRAYEPAWVVRLDALRARRLGPRAGRALLAGLAAGAAAAGLGLAALAVAAAAPFVRPAGPSLPLPLFAPDRNPWVDGLVATAAAMALLAAARRTRQRHPGARGWAEAGAAAVAALAGWPIPLAPWPAALAANFLFFLALLALGLRHGPVATAAAATTAFALPAAAFSALHLPWLAGSLLATALPLAGLAAAGAAGLSRSAVAEIQGIKPPAFLRRLELEKRLKEEMDLLARMQLGLLPKETPALPGWELAARSVLAHEAGGDLYDFFSTADGHFWLAAGDVSGHGHSCAIAQAMTKAALVGSIRDGQRPAAVLAEVDRILRTAGANRSFTSLALVKLAPATGEVVFANAGHPYPLLLDERGVSEIEMPALPLGQGPPRAFLELAIQLPPGGALALCSDGLYEATDWYEVPYGFDRPREVLFTMRHRPAGEILSALLADQRRHLDRREAGDDTTILVIRRLAEPAGARDAEGGGPPADVRSRSEAV